ncbi:MAG TPA: hypothetical protein VJX69_15540 [Terriglobales bacterium]|nr:hypothetical protein [Terriglobales bacterium]
MSKPSENKNRVVETRLAASPSIFLALIVLSAVAFAGEPSPNQLPPGAMQEKAAAACSTCHEARIIVQQRMGKPAWAKEVDKMIKWGAEVDPKDRDAMVDYFSTSFSPDQPPYTAPRSTTQSTQAKVRK